MVLTYWQFRHISVKDETDIIRKVPNVNSDTNSNTATYGEFLAYDASVGW